MFCRERQITLQIFTSPIHALKLERIKRAGRWQDFENWKRWLVKLATEQQNKQSGLQLWDFAYYHDYSLEAIPHERDRDSQMQWYWEGSHYKRTLGDLILAQLAEPNKQSDEFGVLLTRDNIEQHLSRINMTHSRLITEQETAFAQWHNLIDRYR